MMKWRSGRESEKMPSPGIKCSPLIQWQCKQMRFFAAKTSTHSTESAALKEIVSYAVRLSMLTQYFEKNSLTLEDPWVKMNFFALKKRK